MAAARPTYVDAHGPIPMRDLTGDSHNRDYNGEYIDPTTNSESLPPRPRDRSALEKTYARWCCGSVLGVITWVVLAFILITVPIIVVTLKKSNHDQHPAIAVTDTTTIPAFPSTLSSLSAISHPALPSTVIVTTSLPPLSTSTSPSPSIVIVTTTLDPISTSTTSTTLSPSLPADPTRTTIELSTIIIITTTTTPISLPTSNVFSTLTFSLSPSTTTVQTTITQPAPPALGRSTTTTTGLPLSTNTALFTKTVMKPIPAPTLHGGPDSTIPTFSYKGQSPIVKMRS